MLVIAPATFPGENEAKTSPLHLERMAVSTATALCHRNIKGGLDTAMDLTCSRDGHLRRTGTPRSNGRDKMRGGDSFRGEREKSWLQLVLVRKQKQF